jgi:hypothetical protein
MALRHDIRRGALLMLGATALFTIMSAIIKGISDQIHFIETMFFRSAFALPVMFVIAARGRDWGCCGRSASRPPGARLHRHHGAGLCLLRADRPAARRADGADLHDAALRHAAVHPLPGREGRHPSLVRRC